MKEVVLMQKGLDEGGHRAQDGESSLAAIGQPSSTYTP